MSGPFVLAVPSKGRLQENTTAFFKRAGLTLAQGRGVRDYRGGIVELPEVEVAFLSASEIVQQLGAGTVHMGVTGEDLVREQLSDVDGRVELLAPLGFGYANVVVAVPQAWIDVRTMADLDDVAATFHARRNSRMRVATKYINLTRRFFAQQGVTDYRIVESAGATEGAPASGGAELIVDITTTGTTLRANALKVLDDGVMLRSQAMLVAALGADWSNGQKGTARAILGRIAAEEDARTACEIRALVPHPQAVADMATQMFGARALFGIPQAGPLTLVCAGDKVAPLADWLIGQGAANVAVATLNYLFGAQNPLFDRLSRRIEA